MTHFEDQRMIIAKRDPTYEDVFDGNILWVSQEYLPNRVFFYDQHKWKMVGKYEPI